MRSGVWRRDARDREVAFIHVPKTGGTFVGQLETAGQPVVSPITYLGHVTVLDPAGSFERDVPEPFEPSVIVPRARLRDSVVFSNVRNVFTFLVSYLHHAGGINPRYRDTAHYDYGHAQKGLDYLVRVIADRDNPWPSRRFIHTALFAQPTGDFLPDWINFTEWLDDDLALMAARYGLERHGGDKQRVSGYADHRPYYSDGLIDLVASTWAREIELFGFDFDLEKRPDRAAVLGRLSRSSYVWRHDKLTTRPDTLLQRFSRLAGVRGPAVGGPGHPIA